MNIDLFLFLVAFVFLLLLLTSGSFSKTPSKRVSTGSEEDVKLDHMSRLAMGAGFPAAELRPWYWTYKIIFTAGFGAFMLPQVSIAWVLLFMFIGFMIPDLFLLWLGKKRKALISNGLAFYLDLVISFLFSGQSTRRAFLQAREAYAPRHPLVEEISQVSLEWQMGEETGEAFSNLAARTKVVEFELIAVALNLGSKYGAPLYDTLLSQSRLIREKQGEAAEKKIQKAMLKMTIAVILAGLPLFYVILFYPLVGGLNELFEFFRNDAF